MDILASKELFVDLSLWRPAARVRLVSPGAVTVGHVADELVRFLNLPNQTVVGHRILYSLSPGGESGPEASAPIDRDMLVAELEDSAVALVSDIESFVDQATQDVTGRVEAEIAALETEIRDSIDEEIDRWMDKGRAVVIGALDDAMDDIRGRLPARIAGLVPSGRRGVVAQFQGSTTLKTFVATQMRPGYTGAIRTGLNASRHSDRLWWRMAGRVAAGMGGGGVAGAGAGGAVGAATGSASGAGAGATAGAAAGFAVAAGAVIAAAALANEPVRWYVNPLTASESGDLELSDFGKENDLQLDLKAQLIRIRQQDEHGTSSWVALRWPTEPGVGDEDDSGSTGDHSHDDVYAGLEHTHGASSAGDHDHDDSYSALEHDHRTSFDAGFAPPTPTNDADFFVDRCSGVLYGNDKDVGWQPLVELSVIDSEALSAPCEPESIGPGQTLWGLVRQVCGRAPNADLAREVNRTWLANLGVIGSQPDALPVGKRIAVKCE